MGGQRMFSQHQGGSIVDGGIYWSRRAMEFIPVPASGGTLPGGREDAYFRTPILLVLVLGPIMGLAFAIFLPLSGILGAAGILAGRLVGAVAPGRTKRVAVTPAEAVLAGAVARAGRIGEGGKLLSIANEIAEKEWQGR